LIFCEGNTLTRPLLLFRDTARRDELMGYRHTVTLATVVILRDSN